MTLRSLAPAVRLPLFALGLTCSTFLASGAQAQSSLVLGGMDPEEVVCVNANGAIASKNNPNCTGNGNPANGEITATKGNGEVRINVDANGGIVAERGAGSVKINVDGPGTLSTTGNVIVGGTLNMTNGNIINVNQITAATGNFTQLTATQVNATQVNAAQINATAGNITTLNSDTIVNTGHIATATLATSGKAMLDSLEVTNNAEVKGNLTVGGVTNTAGIVNTGNIATTTLSTAGNATIGGNLDMTGGDITNVGTISATTGNFTQITATQVNATQVNAAQVNATVGNITTLNSDTIVNTGNIATTTLSTTGNATVGGDLDMTGGRIANVADPILGTDAANKQYVDAGLSAAFKEIDRNTQGIAIAMAMAGLTLPDGKNFALGANMGFFEDKQAVAVQAAIRINPNLTFVGGFGTGVQDLNTVGGRIGLQAAW